MFNWKDKTDEQAVKIVEANHERLEAIRRDREDLWDMTVSVFRPRLHELLRRDKSLRGKQYGARVYDQGPANSLHKFVAGKLGYMVNRSVPWLQFSAPDARLMTSDSIKRYLQETAEQVLFAAGRSTLYSALVPHCLDADSIGTSVMIPMKDEFNDRVVFDVAHPRDSYLGDNRFGDADVYHRRIDLTRKTAEERFGRDQLPSSWYKDEQLRHPFQEDEYLWAVYPNDDRDDTSRLSLDKRWRVMAILRGDGKRGTKKSRMVMKSGRDRFVIAYRTGRESGSVYGTSISADCLTSALVLNKLSEKSIEAAHKVVEPPVFASSTIAGRLKSNAGGVTAVDDVTREGAKTWLDRINWPITDAQIERVQAKVDDRMFIRFFEILSTAEQPEKTAFEVSQIMGEKAVLMTTIVDTLEQESLAPSIEELLFHEGEAGRLPDPPDELLAAGGTVDIIYLGPLAKLQRALLRGKGIVDSLGIIREMMEMWPQVGLKFDPLNMAEDVAVSQGMPQKLIKSDAEVEAAMQAEAQRQQAAEAAAIAEQAGKANAGLGKAPEEGSPAEALLAGAEG